MVVAQNEFLCLLIAALGGIFGASCNGIVVQIGRWEKHMDEQQQEDAVETTNTKTKVLKAMMYVVWLFCTTMRHAGIFFAPWFGPVSIAWPTYIACLLLANMILIGFIMKHEEVGKNKQVGTIMVVIAVFYITITGPQPQEVQDVSTLFLGNPFTMIWVGMLTIVYVICCFLFSFGGILNESKFSPAFREAVFFTIAVTSSALVSTTSKLYILLSDGIMKTIMIAVSWSITIFWAYFGFYESKYVRSLAKYFPQKTFGSILLNATTGLVVWKEYQPDVIQSWMGYIISLLLLGMGVYLLSELDFFRAKAAEKGDKEYETDHSSTNGSSIDTESEESDSEDIDDEEEDDFTIIGLNDATTRSEGDNGEGDDMV